VKLFRSLGRKGLLWIYRKNQIADFDGISIVDWSQTPRFSEILKAALQLIKNTDSRRYRRVQQHIRFVVSCIRPFGGGAYYRDTRTCEFDFITPRSESDVQFYTAWYACALVHEATHGRLHSLGIEYTPENRVRVEKLCVEEEQRFAKGLTLTPEIFARLDSLEKFDPRRWERSWNTSRWKKFRLEMRRIRRRFRNKSRSNSAQ
jgi:hypothetical protein